jgi:hypothetical protein
MRAVRLAVVAAGLATVGLALSASAVTAPAAVLVPATAAHADYVCEKAPSPAGPKCVEVPIGTPPPGQPYVYCVGLSGPSGEDGVCVWIPTNP